MMTVSELARQIQALLDFDKEHHLPALHGEDLEPTILALCADWQAMREALDIYADMKNFFGPAAATLRALRLKP